MFEVSVEQVFAAGHALRNYYGKTETVHGHNFKLEVVVEGDHLDSTGLLVDFIALKRIINDAVMRLDHQFINDIPPFDELNPSAENLARYFCDEIQSALPQSSTDVPVRVARVKVWEMDGAAATYRPKNTALR